MEKIPTKLKDFRNFLYLVWKHLALPRPTQVQYDIANFIQSKDKRIIINAFRGVGKSWITSAYVCHQLLLNPQLNILVVSASKNRADDFSTFTLRLINEIDVLAKTSISFISLNVNVEKSSALFLDAETTNIFN